MQELRFDYYHGMEAEQYTFYRIPKVLFTAECFRSLSCEAKVLYGLLLDRMSLSIKNGWSDEEGRVYIIFTVEEIASLMSCGTQKAVRILKELDTDKGIGLIEKKRLGLGRPNVIYVKNFIIQDTDWEKEEREGEEMPAGTQNCENHNSRIMKWTGCGSSGSRAEDQGGLYPGTGKLTVQVFPGSEIEDQGDLDLGPGKPKIQGVQREQSKECRGSDPGMEETKIQISPGSLSMDGEDQYRIWGSRGSSFKNCENHNSRIVKTTIQEFPKSQSKDYENHNPRMMKITTQEFPKSQSNDTDINDTELSENECSKTEYNETEYGALLSSHPDPIPSVPSIPDAIREMEAYRDTIRRQISYECFQDGNGHQKEDVDELVELMVEVMMMPGDKALRVAGVERPAVIVKNRFMKLDKFHIDYILERV